MSFFPYAYRNAMLKYQSEIDKIEGCPDSYFYPTSRSAYHFVFRHQTETKVNFQPAVKKKPGRKFKGGNEGVCKALSLSMFTTERLGREFYQRVIVNNPKIRNATGDSLARAELSADDGIMTDVRSDGHYSFFVKDNVDLKNKFELIDVLWTE